MSESERPSQGSVRGKIGRAAAAALVVGSSALAGAGIEATTGVVSQTAGKTVQAGKGLVRQAGQALVGLDNRDFNASSAGIPSQEPSEKLQQAGRVPQPSKP